MFTKEFIWGVVKRIEDYKEAPVLMLEHTNDYTHSKAVVRCLDCNEISKYSLDTKEPIGANVMICPMCGNSKRMGHINLYLN
jgi:hypothetical protein